MFKIKLPANKTKKEILNFFKKKDLNPIIEESKKKPLSANQMIVSNPYMPELKDLYRLYQFVILNKRTTILEFGSGWSSLIFTLALMELKKHYSVKIKSLRRNNSFELFILENEKNT